MYAAEGEGLKRPPGLYKSSASRVVEAGDLVEHGGSSYKAHSWAGMPGEIRPMNYCFGTSEEVVNLETAPLLTGIAIETLPAAINLFSSSGLPRYDGR